MRILLVCLYVVATLSAFAQTKTDSLLQLVNTADVQKKAGIFLELARASIKDSAKANYYNRKAFAIATAQNQKKEQATSVYLAAKILFTSRNFTEAIKEYEKAIPYYQHINDSTGMTTCYSYIGISNFNLSKNKEAIAAYLEGLRLSKNDPDYSAELLANIGLAHDVMDNFTEAISYYKKALALNQSIRDTGSMAIDYDYLGITYSRLKKPDSSLVNYNKALILFKKMKKEDRYAVSLTNTAWVLQNYPDSLDKALNYFNTAWKKFQELGWNHYEPDINHGIGNILSKQGKYNEAIVLLKKSISQAIALKREFLLKKQIYGALAETYQKKGDYRNAYENQILYTQYNDSAVQKEKFEQISRLEKQYETEKKQNEIMRLQSREELMNVELHKNKQLKTLGFVTACLLLFFVMYVLSKYYDKIKLNKLLETKNKRIEQSESELRQLNAAKNKFFSIIAHDLKNPFHNIIGYSQLLTSEYDNFNETERKKFAASINQSTNNVFRLLQNLLEWSRAQTGRLVFLPREIDFGHILKNALSVLRPLADQKQISIELDYDEELTIFADPQMIETVLRNLINNAIKFTPEHGKITISARLANEQVEIRITDTGIGIAEKEAQTLFKIDSTIKRKGTNNEDGSGLGLILCKEFVHKHNGSISVESTPGKGSSFYFILPQISV
ncbi:MAG TPA: ATP-binding protein [Prolixibacteraceae bacterium]|nr:ATP-binding protein [Prolixibacteraceae bacterium]